MPNYTFRNIETGEIIDITMSMKEFDEYRQLNKNKMEQVFEKMNYINDSWKIGRKKPDDSFRDVLREIKKKHSQGFTKSNINTF